MRVQRFATSGSCVTKIIVLPFEFIRKSISIMSFEVLVSNAPVGSSAKIYLASAINALAIATRCFSPPESSQTFFLIAYSNPTPFSKAIDFLNLSTLFSPKKSSGNITFSKAEHSLIRQKFCITIPIFFERYFAKLLSLNLVISTPSTSIQPVVALSIPQSTFNNVVFPEPDLPVIARHSPSSTVRFSLFNAFNSFDLP